MILLIVGIIAFITGLILISCIIEDTIVSITIGFFFLVSLILISAYNATEPKAIDVYQGETTLEITYRDGVPVDSVVIFKKK